MRNGLKMLKMQSKRKSESTPDFAVQMGELVQKIVCQMPEAESPVVMGFLSAVGAVAAPQFGRTRRALVLFAHEVVTENDSIA